MYLCLLHQCFRNYLQLFPSLIIFHTHRLKSFDLQVEEEESHLHQHHGTDHWITGHFVEIREPAQSVGPSGTFYLWAKYRHIVLSCSKNSNVLFTVEKWDCHVRIICIIWEFELFPWNSAGARRVEACLMTNNQGENMSHSESCSLWSARVLNAMKMCD